MRRSHLALTLILATSLLCIRSNADWDSSAPICLLPIDSLSKKTIKHLERAVPAVAANRWIDVYTNLQPVLESATPEEQWDIDFYLGLHQVKRTLGDLVIDARLSSLRENRQLGKRPGPVELSLLLPAIGAELERETKPAREELEIAHQLNMPHAVMDIKSRTLERLLTEVDEARNTLASLKTVSTKIDKATLEALPKSAASYAKLNFVAEDKKLLKMHDELLERMLEICLARLTDNVQLLSSSKAPYEARFTAALRAGDSLAVLNNYWMSYKRRKGKGQNAAQVKKTEDQWKSQERTYTDKVGRLRDKAFHFEEGKKWWLRARFGHGPLGNGLVKVLPNIPGVNSEVILMYYPLQMPDPIPKPPNPINRPDGPPVARRHMLLANATEAYSGGYGTNNRFLLNQVKSAFPNEKLPVRLPEWIDTDPRCIRWVGYLEYQMALYHFGKLAEMTSQAERDAIEDWIGKDDRFTVSSGLSTRYDSLPIVKASPIQFYGTKVEDPRATFPYEHRGLSWVIALAKVELGAMRAAREELDVPLRSVDAVSGTRDKNGNTPSAGDLIKLATGNGTAFNGGEVPNTQPIPMGISYRDPIGPFKKFRAGESDRTAYHEMLFDGARQQFLFLRLNLRQSDSAQPGLFNSLRGFESTIKRLTIAMEFVMAVESEFQTSLTSKQKKELAEWELWLANARSKLGSSVLNAYANTVANSLRQEFEATRGLRNRNASSASTNSNKKASSTKSKQN